MRLARRLRGVDSLPLSTYQSCHCRPPLPQHDLELWREVLRAVSPRPEQLRQMVAHHREYLAQIRPLLAQREASTQRLAAAQAAAADDDMSIHVRTGVAVELAEAGAALRASVQAEYVAWMKLVGAIYRVMDFPLQKGRLSLLSYPFYPQVGRSARWRGPWREPALHCPTSRAGRCPTSCGHPSLCRRTFWAPPPRWSSASMCWTRGQCRTRPTLPAPPVKPTDWPAHAEHKPNYCTLLLNI